MAPNGYYTNGASVCTPQGVAHLFHGVDRPSLEFCDSATDIECTHLTRSDVDLMASWGSNVIRVALDQDRWLSNATLYDPTYALFLDELIGWAEADCMDVILDLHWSDQGDLSVDTTNYQGGAGISGQQPMADVNSLEFWKEVAARYRGDGHVMFELYNEPHISSWNVWLNGGPVGGVQYVGMQALYDTIRNDAQANNLVIAGGIGWAFDLSGVRATPVNGYNIMYADHPYAASDPQSAWDGKFGYLAQGNIAPVIITEFGDNQDTPNCTGAWDTAVIQYADTWNISWTAWGWYVPGGTDGNPPTLAQLCDFPALISDWNGTPTVQGQVVQQALGGYSRAACVSPIQDAGSGEAGASDGGGDAATADGTAPDGASVADGSALDGESGGDATLADAGSIDATAVDGGELDAMPAESDTGDAAPSGDAGAEGASGDDGDAATTASDASEQDAMAIDASGDATSGR
jgi:hypothetical protein